MKLSIAIVSREDAAGGAAISVADSERFRRV